MSNEVVDRLSGVWWLVLFTFAMMIFNIFCIKHNVQKFEKNTQEHFLLIEKHLKIVK